MSARSRKLRGGRARRHRPKLDHPFAPKVLARAARIANDYRIVLENNPDGGYVGYSIELPHVYGNGASPDECVASAREAATAAVAYMIEQGQVPPSPAREEKRHQQINIRLTAEEKLLLEDAARRQGFRGISDFMRSRTLASIRG